MKRNKKFLRIEKNHHWNLKYGISFKYKLGITKERTCQLEDRSKEITQNVIQKAKTRIWNAVQQQRRYICLIRKYICLILVGEPEKGKTIF